MDSTEVRCRTSQRVRYNGSNCMRKFFSALYQNGYHFCQDWLYSMSSQLFRRPRKMLQRLSWTSKRLAVRINGDEEGSDYQCCGAIRLLRVTAARYHRSIPIRRFSIQIYIAALAENATLVMEMNIASGRRIITPAERIRQIQLYSSYSSRLNIHTY